VKRLGLGRLGGERVLAVARTGDGAEVVGTRDAIFLPGGVRIPWEQVQAADWDIDTSMLTVAEIGTWGEERPVHVVSVEDPGLLLELVRERVTASVVLQRHAPVRGALGLIVIARRAPRGDQPLQWSFEYDAGLDPDAPEVKAAAIAALERARDEVGDR